MEVARPVRGRAGETHRSKDDRALRPDPYTEHPTGEGKVYCCLVKDLFSNRIVGCSISDRMTKHLAINALRAALARRGPQRLPTLPPARQCCHDRLSLVNFDHVTSSPCSKPPACPGPWAASLRPVTTQRWNRSTRCSRRTCSTSNAGRPATSSATRSSTGSSTPTTGAAGNADSAASPPSSSSSPSPTKQHDHTQPPSTEPTADPSTGEEFETQTNSTRHRCRSSPIALTVVQFTTIITSSGGLGGVTLYSRRA